MTATPTPPVVTQPTLTKRQVAKAEQAVVAAGRRQAAR